MDKATRKDLDQMLQDAQAYANNQNSQKTPGPYELSASERLERTDIPIQYPLEKINIKDREKESPLKTLIESASPAYLFFAAPTSLRKSYEAVRPDENTPSRIRNYKLINYVQTIIGALSILSLPFQIGFYNDMVFEQQNYELLIPIAAMQIASATYEFIRRSKNEN